jgi:hypothetical protein
MIAMAQLMRVQYEKIGAVFADGELAKDDKNSLFSAELQNSCNVSNNNALAAGILLEPIYHVWVQDTFTLDVCKLVTSKAAYEDAKTFSSEEAVAAAELAGWTWIGTLVTDV